MAQNARTAQSLNHISMRFYAEFSTPSYTSTFCAVGAFPSNTSGQFDTAASALLSLYFHYVRLHFITLFNQSIAFIIPVLIAFLQLKHRGINDQKNTPFATHRTTMLAAVSSSVVYSLACFAILRFSLRRFAVGARICLIWSAYASIASLASLLFPNPIRPFVYAIFGLILAGELLYFLYHKLVASPFFQAYGRGVRRRSSTMCPELSPTYLGNGHRYYQFE